MMAAKQMMEFLEKLRQNNTRDFFEANRSEYKSIKTDMDNFTARLIGRVGEFDPDIARLEVKNCTYRIYRDTRFSKDKTPYKTHWGAFLSRGGKNSPYAGYYLHLESDQSGYFPGIHCCAGSYFFEPPILKVIRRDIYENIDEFLGILSAKELKGFDWDANEKLKKAPQGFPADFEHIDLLKYKGYSYSKDLPQWVVQDDEKLIDGAVKYFRALKPLLDFINYSIDTALEEQKK